MKQTKWNNVKWQIILIFKWTIETVSNTVWDYVNTEKDIRTKYTVKAYNIKPLPTAASLLLKEVTGIIDRSGCRIPTWRVKQKIMTFFWEQANILHHLTWILQMSVDVGFPKAIQQK